MLSIREALDAMLPSFEPVGTETVQLSAARGRRLARDVIARVDLPELDNSAMDGYALRCADLTAAGASLPVVGEARAGGDLPPALAAGHAMRIFTGAPLPAGADTVVMQENTSRDAGGARVIVNVLPKPGANVRARGSDLSTGGLALAKHSLLDPGAIGLLAGLDEAQVEVFRTVHVAILSTGDELRELGEAPRPGSIVNSNAYALAAAVEQAGATALVLPAARDRVDEISARLREGLSSANLLLSIGGVSVGDYDLVEQAMRDAGISPVFHKVAIKPGKPMLFGCAGRVPVVGLPGNPVSALVGFEVFVRPGIARMLGSLTPFPMPLPVELASACERSPQRTELARAQLRLAGGRVIAHLHARQGSGSLPSMAACDALVILPAGQVRLEAGTVLWALRLGDAARSAEPPFDDAPP